MKKLVLLALIAFGFGAQAQGLLTVDVKVNGNPVPGVRVMYYNSVSAFFGNGYTNPPTYENFTSSFYAGSNGVLSFPLTNVTPSDTVFWATKDCSGNFVWGAGSITAMNGNITSTLPIPCAPSDCDAVFKVDSFPITNGFQHVVQAFPMRLFTYTSLPFGTPSSFFYYGNSGSGTSLGFVGSNYDSLFVPSSFASGQLNFCYSRVDSFCTAICDTAFLGGASNPNPAICSPSFSVDTANSGLSQGQLIVLEGSTSNGTIISYDWDFGDGTTISAQYPSHNYTTVGVYNVCLTITAVDSTGIDTCVSTYCDTIGFDANGNLVYKGMTGFTINVIDPATIGLEDKVLESSLSLFPNPATDKAQLTWEASLDVQNVEVYSISGQKLINLQPSSNTAELSGLESGAYLVRVSSKTASKTLRLIIE